MTPNLSQYQEEQTAMKTTIRLGGKNDTYKIPEGGSFTSKLTGGQITNYLKGYVEVPANELGNILPNTHVRYFNEGGQFRLGGYVKKNNDDYFVLSIKANGKDKTWCVCKKKNKIHKKLSPEDYAKLLDKVEMLAKKNTDLTQLCKKLKDDNNKLISYVKKNQPKLGKTKNNLNNYNGSNSSSIANG